MKHRNRLLIVIALLIPAVSIGVCAKLLGELVAVSQTQLQQALERSKDDARRSATVMASGDESEKTYKEAGKRMQELARAKRAVRLEMAEVLRSIGHAANEGDQLFVHQTEMLRAYHQERGDLIDLLRYADARHMTLGSGPARGAAVLRRIMGMSLGDSVASGLRDTALARAQEQILQHLLIARESDKLAREQLHAAAGKSGDQLADLRDEHASLLRQYRTALNTWDAARRDIAASEQELQQLRAQEAAVQADLLAIQSELARIDGRLRSKAERELVQKGLMDDSPDRFRRRTSSGKGEFLWPVEGHVTAGFHEPSYFKYFGMQHQAIDIAVPFATPVSAASDGIVFAVRLGGMKGYTYVMIGHRGGYATVYGHLSSVSVRAGDTVSAGEIIGKSGGLPGTEGAGRMTTGAHLHFEVIKNGEHVDPKSVLP